DFSEGDYYDDYLPIVNNIRSTITQNPNAGTGEKAAALLLTGLLGGALQQGSEGYRKDARDAYSQVVLGSLTGEEYDRAAAEDVLGSKLFNVADQEASALFKLAQAEEQRQFNQDVDKAVIAQIAQNPYQKDQILAALPPGVR